MDEAVKTTVKAVMSAQLISSEEVVGGGYAHPYKQVNVD